MTEQDLKSLYQSLEKYKNFDKDSANCEKFLATVDAIVVQKNPESIPVLFQYLDDKSEYSWVMEELMLGLEQYQTVDLLLTLIKDPQWYWKISPLRTRGLLYGIINSPADFKELKNFLTTFPISESFLKVLFDSVKLSQSPHHAELLKELQLKLKKPY